MSTDLLTDFQREMLPAVALQRLVTPPARVAYADPPYMGQAKKHYRGDPRCAEVNHRLLIAYLEEFDGWALSCTSNSLRQILALCPEKVRVASWVKTFCAFKKGVYPAYAWEPVVFRCARKVEAGQPYERDWVGCQIRHRKTGTSVVGSKPPAFCYWLFRLLNAKAGDEFNDVFPGSGSVGYAWNNWCRQMTLLAV